MPFRSRCPAPYRLVAPGDVERIHTAALEVLAETGVKFADPAALRLLAEHGCDVDHARQIVRMPSQLVEVGLQRCPAQFTLCARNPAYDIVFDPTSVHFAAGSGMEVLDVDSMQRRPGTSADAATTARLCEALENIAGTNTGLGWLADKPAATNLEWQYAIALRNSQKINSVAVMDDSELWGIRMARAADADIIVSINSASPLGWTADQIEGARRATAADLPVGLQSMASPGVTAPATLAGTAIVMHAEILSMNTFIQLLRPGTGIMYSCFTLPLDMRTTLLASGSIELGMLTVLSAQLSKHCGMGSIIYLPMTDAKLPDEQAGYEKAMQWLLAGMAGINLIWGAGMVEGHTLWSDAQLVIEAEMAAMVGRCLDGVTVSAETLAMDTIREVGHFPNGYLQTDHTLRWWRAERYLPLVAARDSFEQWTALGRPDVLRRADEKARAILACHAVTPLPPEADREIEALLAAAAREKAGA